MTLDLPLEMRAMELAPRDGTWVILIGEFCGEPRACAAFWSDDGWFETEAASQKADAFFTPSGWLPLPAIWCR